MQLLDVLREGGMSRRSAATHADTGEAELIADRGPGKAQFGTDLALGPTLGVRRLHA